MGKELLVARHAKSSWSDSSLSDHDRPLNKRGHRDAPKMADWIAQKELVPDLVLSSSANRAITTARIYCEQWTSSVEPAIFKEFYLADPLTYLETLATLVTPLDRVMVVGHNPGLESLVEVLTGEDEIMPTAAIAHIRVAVESWSDLARGSQIGTLVEIFRPKALFGD